MDIQQRLNPQSSQSIQQSSSSQNIVNNNQKPIQPTAFNFIKSFQIGILGQNVSIANIYENQPFTAQIISIKRQNYLNSSTGMPQLIWPNNQKVQDIAIDQIHFETVPYDCKEVRKHVYVASNRSMPLRIYRKEQQGISHIGTIIDRKQNSQKYLSPIKLGSIQGDSIIGAGQKFLSIYNLQKLNARRNPFFDHINISTVQNLQNDQNIIIAGSFQGNIYIIDNRTDGKPVNCLQRPHIDAITSIAANDINHNLFATNARKDDFTYLWDFRNMNNTQIPSFDQYFLEKRLSNQRIGLSFNKNGTKLISGSQNAKILVWDINQKSTEQYNIAGIEVVNCVGSLGDNMILFSTGQRVFDEDKKINNMLGCIKIQ